MNAHAQSHAVVALCCVIILFGVLAEFWLACRPRRKSYGTFCVSHVDVAGHTGDAQTCAGQPERRS